ncbi:MAG: 6-bladed beta-propeller [Candidatus Aminicenantales bacterium]
MTRPTGNIAAIFGAIVLTVCLYPAANADRSLAEIYKTGKVRFVPEMTITDAAMGGKEFFGMVMDIALDDQGFIYVCDYKTNNIKKFDSSGKFLRTIGKAGQGPGDFDGPSELEFSHGRLVVREGMNRRVSILHSDGSFIKSIPIDFQKGSWMAMRALPDGRFMVQKEKVDYNDLNAPQELYLDLYSAELDYIKTIYHRQVRSNKYIREPYYSNVPIPFAPMVYWDVTADGKIAVGYSDHLEIEIYDPDKGKISGFTHSSKAVEVTSQDQEQFFANMSSSVRTGSNVVMRRGAPEWIVKNTEFPKYFSAFRDVKVDGQGNIWVVPWTSASQKAAPDFDAFTPDGKFLGRVQIDDEKFMPYRPFWLPNGFWSAKTSADGEYQVVKYKITGLN